MSGGIEFEDAAAWRRWHNRSVEAGDAAAEPDALTLAAYAEQRLGRVGIDPEADPAIAAVEAWLAEYPDAIDDIAAARAAADPSLDLPRDPMADAAVIARGQALIATPGAKVVALRPPRRDWRSTVAWGGIAASMLAVALIGFSLGDDGVVELSDTGTNPVLEQPLIGAQATVLAIDDEDNGI